MTIARRAATPGGTPAATWLLLAYALFVVYGSLVPLDFKPYPLAQAWADFHRIPFLTLGVESRADWVANGVLYAPLGFWAVRSLVAARLRPSAAGVVALLLGAALAVAVEFAQLFFPPRTVSQNDILAEVIGSGVGALAACLAGDWLAQLAGGWASGGGRLTRRLLELYAAGYTALCFFPYDLLLSAAELQDKLQSDAWGWLLAPHAAGSAKTALMLLVEAALAAPIGAWLVLRRRTSHAALALPPPLLAAALLGALFGVVVEGGQFFIATGISQGASVLTRAAGFAAGAWLAPQLQRTGTTALRQALRRPALLLALPYLALVFGASGVLSHGWRTVPEVVAAWADLHLLPFYYHYYTTEAIALVSLGSVALMFVPAAVLGWARGWPAAVTLAAVALLAAVVESLKLLLTGLHPDPTNVLIGAAAAATVLRLLGLLEAAVPPAATTAGSAAVAGFAASAGRGAAGATRAADAADAARDADADADAANAANAANAPPANAVAAAPAALSAWLLVLPVVAAQAFLFPVLPLGLTLLLAACAALVWRWPLLPLALLPALLPVLDLAPWSGRLFWDAYDMVSAVCLAVALHRTRGAGREPQPRWLPTAFALLAASLLASVVQALGPPSAWPALADDNAFTSLYSPFNALRVAKGAVWAWLFALLWRRLAGAGAGRNRWFSAGMLAGLAGSVAAVLWERTAFTTLADTAADFRVSGLFSTMNTGGAFIECWLAVATAFALAAALRVRSWPTRVAALVLLAGAAYALAVTYSRNGYAALAAVVIATLLSAVGPGGRPPDVADGPGRWLQGRRFRSRVVGQSCGARLRGLQPPSPPSPPWRCR